MTSAHNTDSVRRDAGNWSYNLFRSKRLPEIVCAVPEDRPVPDFIDAEGWEFQQPLRPADTRPLGFHESAAHTGVRFNGFYLFYAVAMSPVVRTALDLMVGNL